jgi:hypothetical protein
VLLNCVELFCKWSGQTISIEKSGWFVSKGVHSNLVDLLRVSGVLSLSLSALDT